MNKKGSFKLTSLDRSVTFVSLDTHPANNALVVSYEIQVSLYERTGSQREISKRTKRDQHLILLNSLKSEDFNQADNDKIGHLLAELSERILNKCPLLAASNQTVDDIRPHLLYLISRRQSQVSSSCADEPRPPSSASQRLQLATSTHEQNQRTRRFSAGSARRSTSRLSNQQVQPTATGGVDTYSALLTDERRDTPWSLASVKAHLLEVDSHLDALVGHTSGQATPVPKLDADQQLDGLYGDWTEKLAALVSLVRLSRDDDNLMRLSSSRLLTCALLRTLRDSSLQVSSSSHGDQVEQVRLSILLLIARVTSFTDTYQLAFGRSETETQQSELTKELASLLASVIPSDLIAPTSGQLPVFNQIYGSTLNLALIIVHNLFKLAQLERGEKLLASLVGELISKRILATTDGLLFEQSLPPTTGCGLLSQLEWLTKSLIRDLRLQNKTSRKLVLLSRLLSLLKQISIYREFVGTCARAGRLADVLVELLAALQLSRPVGRQQLHNSGGNSKGSNLLDVGQASELLCLELELFGFINNLLLDKRLKAKLLRKNLLKYTLRSLVVFLAHLQADGSGSVGGADGTGSSLEPQPGVKSFQIANALARFGHSQILLAPFKCLYELTCLDQVRLELLKSRIVIKCLLDYLQSASSLLLESVRECAAGLAARKTTAACRTAAGNSSTDLQLDSATIGASEYILCIWINLSARHVIPSDFHEDLLSDCIQLASDCLSAFRPSCPNWHLVYLQAKLLRNLAGQAATLADTGGTLAERLASLTKESLEAPHTGYLLACEFLWAISGQLKSSCSRGQPASRIELELVNCLLETIDWRGDRSTKAGADEQEDDLLLAATVYLHRLASCKEICSSARNLSWPMLEAVERRQGFTDRQLLLNWLYLLRRLMNHRQFLRTMPRTVALVDRLTCLMLDFSIAGSEEVGALASEILEQFCQLERLANRAEDNSSPAGRLGVDERRFLAYNEKWLSAIRASGRDAAGGAGLVGEPAEQRSNSVWPGDLEFFVNRQDYDFERATSSAGSGAAVELTDNCCSSYLSEESQDEEQSILDDEYLDAPDVGVIDAKSMIEHLARG